MQPKLFVCLWSTACTKNFQRIELRLHIPSSENSLLFYFGSAKYSRNYAHATNCFSFFSCFPISSFFLLPVSVPSAKIFPLFHFFVVSLQFCVLIITFWVRTQPFSVGLFNSFALKSFFLDFVMCDAEVSSPPPSVNLHHSVRYSQFTGRELLRVFFRNGLLANLAVN